MASWWEPYEATMKSMFDAIDEPTRLSQLLARIEAVAAAVTDDDDEPLDSGLLVPPLSMRLTGRGQPALPAALWAIASW